MTFPSKRVAIFSNLKLSSRKPHLKGIRNPPPMASNHICRACLSSISRPANLLPTVIKTPKCVLKHRELTILPSPDAAPPSTPSSNPHTTPSAHSPPLHLDYITSPAAYLPQKRSPFLRTTKWRSRSLMCRLGWCAECARWRPS